MASSKEYRDFVLEQASELNLTYKPMMSEYLLYFDGIYFGGVFDDRLLVKITPNGAKFGMREQLPYDGAKPMYFVEEIDDGAFVCDVIRTVSNDLKKKAK